MRSVAARLLTQSQDAALSAVQIFNSPLISFKSETFILLMNLAWTYLLHAHYRKTGVEYQILPRDGPRPSLRSDYRWFLQVLGSPEVSCRSRVPARQRDQAELVVPDRASRRDHAPHEPYTGSLRQRSLSGLLPQLQPLREGTLWLGKRDRPAPWLQPPVFANLTRAIRHSC
jgi:hypothetical protein